MITTYWVHPSLRLRRSEDWSCYPLCQSKGLTANMNKNKSMELLNCVRTQWIQQVINLCQLWDSLLDAACKSWRRQQKRLVMLMSPYTEQRGVSSQRKNVCFWIRYFFSTGAIQGQFTEGCSYFGMLFHELEWLPRQMSKVQPQNPNKCQN